MTPETVTINDRHPNFRDETGKLFLVRCFQCETENYAMAVASGTCAWCGWTDAAITDLKRALAGEERT